MPFTRRGFLRGAATVAGAAAVYALNPEIVDAKVEVPKKWDKVYDVVIIGYGGAGAAAAITAHDAGAKVVILEKMHEGGGNTAVSSGGLLNPNDREAAGKYVRQLFEYSKSDMDEDLIKAFLDDAMNITEWVKGLKPGTEMKIYGHAGFPNVEGAVSMDKWSVSSGKSGGGPNLWDVYSYAVEDVRKIPVMLNSPAKRIVSNDKGEIVGVIASVDGKDCSIKARKSVVLTCGGYEFDEKILQNFVKGYPIYALGNPGNTGDGIRMAQEVGASLWHMNGVSCPIGIKVPGYKSATVFTFTTPGYILVDRGGERFIDEKSVEHHAGLLAVDTYDGHALMYKRIPCYAIFDDKARAEGGPINGPSKSGYIRNKENFKWSRDNLAEIEKGYIIKGNTIEELAAKINVDPAVLKKTVSTWNKDVKAGKDSQFNRAMENKVDASKAAYKDDRHAKILSAPIEKGPFYAVEIYPTILNTQGGPKRNVKAQVLNPFDEPIKRLYCAGELGSLWGLIYQGAGNNAESVVFGRIAGKNAAAEKAWD